MALFVKQDASGRPVFLNLLKISLPLSALVSIMHRMSGVCIIVVLPFVAWQMTKLLHVPSMTMHPMEYWVLHASVIGMSYHALAGIRHLYHDLSGDHHVQSNKVSAFAVLLLWGMWLVLYLVGVAL